jgi:energy-coupling factor transporter ATP-binding protein EcfA2
MKVLALKAAGVHGYIDFDITFHKDITFLYGLNGSGKTTALRLVSALLTPRLEEIYSIEFQSASVDVVHNEVKFTVSATRGPGRVTLEVTGQSEQLEIKDSEIQLLSDARRIEGRSPVVDRLAAHPVVREIASMPNPILLGLDRRHISSAFSREEADEARHREFLSRSLRGGAESSFRSGALSIGDAAYLLLMRSGEIRAQHAILDESFRDFLLRTAFSPPTRPPTFEAPDSVARANYEEKLTLLDRAADGLRGPLPAMASAIEGFLSRMREVLSRFELKRSDDRHMVEWVTIEPTVARLLDDVLPRAHEYLAKRAAVGSQVDRFVSTVNSFIRQSGKRLSVEGGGEMSLSIEGYQGTPPLAALSSGERQLLVMFAHLALGKELASSQVLMIDEPELSLHIDWQSRFASALLDMNPSVQFILATHSPAIVMDRAERMASVGSGAMK